MLASCLVSSISAARSSRGTCHDAREIGCISLRRGTALADATNPSVGILPSNPFPWNDRDKTTFPERRENLSDPTRHGNSPLFAMVPDCQDTPCCPVMEPRDHLYETS